jgi:succinate dehydrogenase / fumarate reductase, iron-sulfur subunit
MNGRRRRPVGLVEAAADAETSSTKAATATPVPASAASSVERDAARPVDLAAAADLAAVPDPTPPPIRFRISRSERGNSKPHFDEFDADPKPGTTVLDVLIERRRHDPSLVIRHSCMHGSCGTCGVRINGRETLACDTQVADLKTAAVKVEPLANQRLVADLATDMVDFYARFEAAGLPIARSVEGGSAAPTPESVKVYTRFEDCIECGLCLSACPIARVDRSYIGPAALAAAARVVEEPRGQPLGPVFALAAEPDSVWRCRDAMQCTAVCPSAVDPAGALFRLRRKVAFDRVKSIFGRGHAGQARP